MVIPWEINPNKTRKEFKMEVWKEIPNTDGFYYVSNMGRVKSSARPRVMSNGTVKHYKEFILKPINHTHGYLSVNLYLGKGKQYKRLIHILVAEAFIPKYIDGLEVNHKDGNKHNNCVENLEWCTRKENVHHCNNTGLRSDVKKVAAIKNGKVVECGNFSRELAEKLKKDSTLCASVETVARVIRKTIDTGKMYYGYTFVRI